MIVPASLLRMRPSGFVRRAVTTVLTRSVARAFQTEVPAGPHLFGVCADDELEAFRSFTAELIEAALEAGSAVPGCSDDNSNHACYYYWRLFDEAKRLGGLVRRVARVRPAEAMPVASYFYACIGIELVGELPGELRFERCYFAQRYTPQVCAFMAAFDGGFMAGLVGVADAAPRENPLRFSSRITEGCEWCSAICDGHRAPHTKEDV